MLITYQKTNKTKTYDWRGSKNVVVVFNEPTSYASSSRGVDGVYKFVNATPFTSIASRRFEALRNIRLRTSVLSKSISKSVDEDLILKANSDVRKSFFKGTTGKLEELDLNSEAYLMRLGALSRISDSGGLAEDTDKNIPDGVVTIDEIEKVILYMEEDFSDGDFDGKKIDNTGLEVSLSSTEYFGSITSSNAGSFLSSKFMTALKEYLTNLGSSSLPAALAESQSFCDDSSVCKE